MGFTAERVAERWKVSRADQDAWALGSHRKAAQAWQAGRFADQIVAIKSDRVNGSGAVETIEFCRDELVRTDTTAERLAKLQPAFKLGGTVTAGNASPYSDGAAALVVMKRAKAESLGLPRSRGSSRSPPPASRPDVMGVGPIKAVPKALRLAGMSLAEIDLIEFNEAFASQILASMRDRHGRGSRERQRRGDRARPPTRRDRCEAHDAAHPRAQAPRWRARARHDVRGRRDGCRGDLRGGRRTAPHSVAQVVHPPSTTYTPPVQ